MTANADRVVHFYDTHPINESQIMAALAERGVDLDQVSEDVLQEHDQDHYGGLAANRALAEAAGVRALDHVLDVACGLGGPARWLAHNFGCRVTGLDLTASRIDGARRLTALAGIQGRVDFHCGNALDMPFGDAAFDVIISQEAWAHVPGKPTLIAECARVLRPGGRLAFTDILAGTGLRAAALARLQREMAFAELATVERYRTLLTENGIQVTALDDLGPHWTKILEARLEMFRSLEPTTVAKFGADHFARWDATYAFFVARFQTGELTGARFVGRRR